MVSFGRNQPKHLWAAVHFSPFDFQHSFSHFGLIFFAAFRAEKIPFYYSPAKAPGGEGVPPSVFGAGVRDTLPPLLPFPSNPAEQSCGGRGGSQSDAQ